jgi:hypothetical protein
MTDWRTITLDEVRTLAEQRKKTGCGITVSPAWLLERLDRLKKLEGKVSKLRLVLHARLEQLAAIKKEWQYGIGEINGPWEKRMAELVGDHEGLSEAAEAAGGDA